MTDRGDTTGKGILAFLGSILGQNNLTGPIMNAGRAGLLAARTGRERDDEAGLLDHGEAFLGVGPAFGYESEQAQGGMRPAAAPGASAAPLPASMGMLPTPRGRTAPAGSAELSEKDIEGILADIYDPFGRIS